MISDSAIAALWDMCSSPSVVAAIQEVIDHEVGQRVELMRSLLRAGNISAAHAVEGSISVLEDFPSILAAHAAKYEVNRV